MEGVSAGMASIAVLMTCHNRRPYTERAIKSLLLQQGLDELFTVRIFLTDDGCTDGTAESVMRIVPDATLIPGNGELYWAAGMAESEAVAMSTGDFDYLLWLNDDVALEQDALLRLLAVSAGYPQAIVVGAVRDPESGQLTYGARVLRQHWHPQRLYLLPESEEAQFADSFNGNVVLIPRSIRTRVGPIDGEFPHAYADDDYGLRASRMGIAIVQAPKTVGSCTANPQRHAEPLSSSASGHHPGGLAAWKAAQHPKGVPWRAQLRYLRRHGGPMWPLIFAGQQVRLVIPRLPNLR